MDSTIVLYLNHFAASSPALSFATVFFAEHFPYLVALLFAYVAWRQSVPLRDRVGFFLEGVVVVLLSRAVFVELIRFFIHRPRPFVEHAVTVLLSESSFSFPSGHAALFFALSTVVYAHNKRWGWAFFIASSLIGLARIAAGVHYPSDILGGALLGIAVGWCVVRIRRYLVFPDGQKKDL